MKQTEILVDENSKWLSFHAEVFASAGLAITNIGDHDVPKDRSSDEEIFEFCVSNKRMLITENGKDFKRILTAGNNRQRASGAGAVVFAITQKGATPERAKAICRAICECLSDPNQAGKVYIPISHRVHEILSS